MAISNYMYLCTYAKDSQKIKKKKKTKTPRITDEGWNSQKRLSDPVEKKMKAGKRRKKRLLYLHPKLSSGLVPLKALLQNRHIACRKMVSLDFSYVNQTHGKYCIERWTRFMYLHKCEVNLHQFYKGNKTLTRLLYKRQIGRLTH